MLGTLDLLLWSLALLPMVVMENWTQVAFQYRDDDGSEVTATDRAAVNANDTLTIGVTYRMRIGVQGTHTGGSGSYELATPTFEYNVDAAGWNPVTTSSGNVKAVASADTTWTITDGDATTEQLAQSQTFVAGEMDENGTSTSLTLSDTEESEWELVFQLVSPLAGGESVQLRITENGTALDAYTQTPSITVASVASTLTINVTDAITATNTPTMSLVAAAAPWQPGPLMATRISA